MYRTFDALGRMTAEEHLGVGVYYQWDAASRNTRITWPDGYYARYVHDVTGAVIQVRENGVTSGAGVLATYGYDDLGRRTSVTRGNGAVSSYGWDGGSRLTSLGIDLTGTSQDATWTLGYNPAGQVVSRALSNSAYAYSGQPTLDDAYSLNGLNQVTAVDSTGVYYDGRGNITGDGTSEWAYDASNRIVNGDYTGSDIGTYSYDPASRLSRITAGGVDSRFLYAGAQAVGEYDSSGALIRRYVPGAGLDDYAAYTVGTTTITRDWPVVDPLGSVVGVTNSSATATTINTYDEYGVPGTFSGRFGYAGSMYLNRAMAAPWNMRNRQYNPSLGRFMQTDPIGIAGGVNLYGYVGNDPVNLVDPWGLQVCPPGVPGDCVGDVVVTGRRYDDLIANPSGRPSAWIAGQSGVETIGGLDYRYTLGEPEFGTARRDQRYRVSRCMVCMTPEYARWQAEVDEVTAENNWMWIPALAPVAVVGVLEAPAALAWGQGLNGGQAALHARNVIHVTRNVRHGLTHVWIQAGGRRAFYNSVQAAVSRSLTGSVSAGSTYEIQIVVAGARLTARGFVQPGGIVRIGTIFNPTGPL